MKNKKLTSLIIRILILSAATIFILWKTKSLKKEKQEVIKTAFQLNDTLSGFSMNLPDKPIRQFKSKKRILLCSK